MDPEVGELPVGGPPSASDSIERSDSPRDRLPFVSFLIFAIGYALANRYSSQFGQRVPAPLWFPDSVLICALLLVPKRHWVWYLIAAFPIRALFINVPFWFFLASTANDCLKAICVVSLLQHFTGGPVRLNTLRQLWIYIGIAAVLIPALSAVLGAATRLPLGNPFWRSWYQWFLGNATAALVLTPTLLYWCVDWRQFKLFPRRFVTLIAAIIISLYWTFVLSNPNTSLLITYVPIPLLILAATNFKPLGVSTSISLMALISIISAVEGRGAFGPLHSHDRVLSIQLFLLVISVPMLFVAILIEEREVAQEHLRASQKSQEENYNRIRDLAGRLLSAQEDERRKIARELHDDIGQRLSLLSIQLDELSGTLQGESTNARFATSQLLIDLQNVITDIHNLSHQLHSRGLEQMGLEGALRSLCRAVARQHRINVELHSDHLSKFPLDKALCIFRVAQEALQNAVKHGRAEQIEVDLRQKSNSVYLAIRDTGVGFDVKAAADGLGLVSMHERVHFLGGTLDVRSQKGKGTEILARLPLHNRLEDRRSDRERRSEERRCDERRSA
jgi:two-component system sensor histidine kinase UhpB